MFKTTTGVEIAGLQSHGNGNGIEYVEAGSTVQFSFEFKCILLPGVYFMNAGVVGKDNGMEIFLHRIVDAISIRVVSETGLCVSALVDISSSDTRDNCVLLLE
jgi:lipopolysaccharide transport system ATP-binding protein